MEIDKTEALKLVEGLEGSDDLKISYAKQQLEQSRIDAELKAQERAQLIIMRGGWSKWVLYLLCFIVITDTLFVYFVGLRWLNFSNEYVIPTLIGEGLLKTIGLAYIIVHFLFSKDSISSK